MKLMEGKKGIIFGVSNARGIAYAIAKQIHEVICCERGVSVMPQVMQNVQIPLTKW